jgi:DNA polymerase-3 subunit gamma/tau
MADDHYQVLARRWRPQKFDDVVGQEHISRTLQNALRSGRISHAYLFVGSRGIGKTTSARILARCLNCRAFDAPTPEPCGQCDTCRSIAAGTNIDVIEIDGASNNSVEDVRQIRDNIRLVPSSSRYKIYVIDEVHQLSTAAFNALLKTLEEPPAHAVFILATTESHKIPATIISRCQRFDFRRVGIDSLVALLRRIVEAEGRSATPEALHAIARAADGGVRDAESILDQLLAYSDEELGYQDVNDVLGLVDWRTLHDLCDALAAGDVVRLMHIVDDVVAQGSDLTQFVQEILRYFRSLLILRAGAPAQLLALPEDEIAAMRDRAARYTLTQLIRLVEQFSDLSRGLDNQLAQRTALEALLIRISKRTVDVSLDSVLEKLSALRDGGDAAHPAAAGPGAADPAPPKPAPPKKKSAPEASGAPASPARATQKRPAREAAPPKGGADKPGLVDPADAREMLDDPGLASVIKAFRGKIVEVNNPPPLFDESSQAG